MQRPASAVLYLLTVGVAASNVVTAQTAAPPQAPRPAVSSANTTPLPESPSAMRGEAAMPSAAAVGLPAGALVGGECDRICLTGILEQYLGALARHEPSSAPLSVNIKFTENTVRLPVGEGLWLGVTEPATTFRFSVIDPVSDQAGFFGLMKAWGAPALVAIRIKVVGSKIVEAEHLIARPLRAAAMTNLITPRAGMLEDVQPRERNSREALIHIAQSYFDAVEQDKGALAPFADECERHENGVQTTSNQSMPLLPAGSGAGSLAEALGKISMLGCKANIDSGVLSYITRVEPRRPLIVDEQKGLVFAFPMFVARGDKPYIEIKGVPGVDRLPASGLGASNVMAGEVFKIRNGKIYEVEGLGVPLPYMSRTGWEEPGAAASSR